MNSTFTSDEILRVSNLGLAFRHRPHRETRLRDVFINALRSPLDALLRPKTSVEILRGVTFTLKPGDRLGLLGINGCGKSSLCRAIAGMYRPSLGSVSIQGSCRSIFDTQAGVLPELTGRENAALLARLMYPRLKKPEMASLIQDCLEFSGLGTQLDTPLETFSQGMKSRLFLSLATARPAGLLILDEVYDSADQFFRAKIRARLLSVIRDSGAALLVSHASDHIRESCNRAAVLHDGKLVFDGSVDAAYRVYALVNGQLG